MQARSIVMALLLTAFLGGQEPLNLPQLSPRAAVTEVVGTTSVQVDYHRPAVKGRRIWGELVPFGVPWRMGANEATTIRFSDAVKVNGNPLPAGTYALFAIPAPEQWTLVFSRNWRQMGAFEYNPKDDVLRISVNPKALNGFTEWLHYDIEPASRSSAYVDLRWERLRVSFLVEVDLDSVVNARIRNALARAGNRDWRIYSDAATYFLEQNTELTQALNLVDRSLRISENPTNLYVKGRILRELGQLGQALSVLERALALARNQGASGSTTGPIQQTLDQWKRLQAMNGGRK